MHVIRIVALLLATLVGASPLLSAREEAAPTFEAARKAAFDAAMEAERDRQELVGLAVAVIEVGTLAHVGSYGLADRGGKRPVTSRTLFRWASVSKPVTAVAALQLVEQGKLDLDASAGTWWPSLPADGLGSVPLDALLRQQGGVGHYREMGAWSARLEQHYGDRGRVPWAADRSVAVMEGPPLLFEPYARYHYTTFGYNLIGALVEAAGDASFEAQVDERIAKPLGMRTFEPDYGFRRRKERARGYRKRDGEIVDSASGDVSWKLPGGGFHSTVGDMARFGVGLLGDALLRPASMSLLTTVTQPRKGRTSYAMGISVKRRGGVVTRLSHSGAQAKTRALLVLHPHERRGFAIMTNSEWANAGEVGIAIERALGW